jgi:hypothetical protein
MKRLVFLVLTTLFVSFLTLSQTTVRFDDFFVDKTMRIDYYHIGDSKDEIITIDHIYQQGVWAGNPKKLLDASGNGHYYVKVYDSDSTTVLFSKGFDCYYDEYRTTVPAGQGIKRTYHESMLIPYPKRPVVVVLQARDRRNTFHPFFSQRIDPKDYHIIKKAQNRNDRVIEIVKNGGPHEKLDLVFISEGYTNEQEAVFKSDLERYTKVLLNFEPYKQNKDKINIYGVFRPSIDSGVTQPRQGIYKNTIVSSSFNALDTDRYLLTEDNKTIRDIASAVPYDALCIMVNSERYGGGGLYNDYTIFTTHNTYSENVFLHEFGHGFAGLADEYYTSDVSYVDFFPQGVEPVEPNITALLDPKNLKWKDLVSPGVSIPTEWHKDLYDSLQLEQQRIGKEMQDTLARLREKGVGDEQIKKTQEEFRARFRKLSQEIKNFLTEHPLKDKIGAFEGAGFSSKGLYRPSVNCIMFSNEELRLCKVCERSIVRVIEHYTE